jgi:catechol 2,3-dioxygenase-like lactoylglutathione lyase family enzyme
MEFIEVVSIPVSDQVKSKEFYLHIGFELITDTDMGNGARWVQLGFPGQTTSITLITWFTNIKPGASQGLVIRSNDIEKDVEELRAKGVTIDKIDPTPWGKFATFHDPDGNSMILRQE